MSVCHAKSISLIIILFSLLEHAHANSNNILRIANVVVPSSFADALKEGLTVPVHLQYNEVNKQEKSLSNEVVGNATLLLRDGQLHLFSIDFSAVQQQGLLNEALVAILSSEELRVFSLDGKLQINDNASMQLDLISMLLTVYISREAFAPAIQQTASLGLAPSVDGWTSVHRYNAGYSFSRDKPSHYNDASYVQLDSMIGLGSHHLALSTALYNVGKPEHSGEFYRAFYEQDLDGRRIAGGMVSTWDLQSLGMVTGLNAGRIYGVSYGNQTQSRVQARDESVTPIQVFMPANGEVRVYRDGRMIGLQNLPIGNQHVDTSVFPHGIYNVTVEVYVDGRVVDTTTQRVTKTGGGTEFINELGWQVWGGLMEKTSDVGGSRDDFPLLGVSLARTFDTVDLSTATYVYQEAAIGETNVRWLISDNLNTQLQTMVASDASWRFASSANVQFSDNATLWGSQERLNTGSVLGMRPIDLYSMGVSLNLAGWVNGFGQLSFNTTHDKYTSSDRSYVDYFQHIYSGRYGTLSMRASIQSDNGAFSGFNNKSVSLDYSIPLGHLFTFGVSANEQGQKVANLNYQKQMEGAINLASVNVSQVMQDNNDDSTNLSGTFGFETKLIGGTTTLNRNHMGDLSGNLITRGALVTSEDALLATSQNLYESGIVIKTGMKREGQLLARVNGMEHTLRGDQTFVALPAYQEYEVELLNSKATDDSYELNMSKQRFILFPGNVATLDARNAIKEMVTVFGVIRAEDGSPLANVRIDNHIGTTLTSRLGEFSLDVDKAHPILTFRHGDAYCEAELDLSALKGAVWLGDITCYGLKSFANLSR